MEFRADIVAGRVKFRQPNGPGVQSRGASARQRRWHMLLQSTRRGSAEPAHGTTSAANQSWAAAVRLDGANGHLRRRLHAMTRHVWIICVALGIACSSVPHNSTVCDNGRPVSAPANLLLPGYVLKRPAPRALVFVHGLGGDGRTSWTNARTGNYWPAAVADDPALASFDVYVYEYPTNPTGNCLSVTDVANDLRLRLLNDRVVDDHVQIVFVAHSMGGLIVRTLLLRNRESITPKVPAVLFYGTPSAGASKANLGSLFTRCAQVQDLRTIDSNSFLQNQQSDWMTAGLQDRIATYCAFEVPPNSGVTVDRTSATSLCSKDPQPIYGSHSDVVKPACANDTAHIFLRTSLQQLPSPGSSTTVMNDSEELKRRNAYLEDLVAQRFRRRQIREQLGQLLLQGQSLVSTILKGASTPLPEAEANKWFVDVQRYLAQALDSSYVARFISTRPGNGMTYGLPREYESLYLGLNERMDTLRKFIEELKD